MSNINTAFSEGSQEPASILNRKDTRFFLESGEFTLGITNFKYALEEAYQNGADGIVCEYFPDDRNYGNPNQKGEAIRIPLPDKEGSDIAKMLFNIQTKVIAKVQEQANSDSKGNLFNRIKNATSTPDPDDIKQATKIIIQATQEELSRYGIPDTSPLTQSPFTMYRLPFGYKAITNNPENKPYGEFLNGSHKTQDLDDLANDLKFAILLIEAGISNEQVNKIGESMEAWAEVFEDSEPALEEVNKKYKDVERFKPFSADAHPFEHVFQCETISLMMGIVSQSVMLKLMGKHAPTMINMVHAGDYRTEPNDYVEHTACAAIANFTTPTGEIEPTLFAYVCGSGETLCRTGVLGGLPGRDVFLPIPNGGLPVKKFTDGHVIVIPTGDGRDIHVSSKHVLTHDDPPAPWPNQDNQNNTQEPVL